MDELIQPTYQAVTPKTELVARVLMHKQQEYDTVFANLSNLRDQSLGIRFLNAKEQKKIDAFNTQLQGKLAGGDLGDLSDGKVAAGYYSMFDTLTKDRRLISRFRADAKYQEEMLRVEQKRASKDPTKAGFHPVNYENYMARLDNYVNADLDTEDGAAVTVAPYVDYVNYGKEIGSLMKQVPVKKFSTSRAENGYIIKDNYEGRDPQEVKAVVSDFMSGPGAAQAREEAEFAFRKAKGNPFFQQTVYDDYTDKKMAAQKTLASRLAALDEELKHAPASKAADIAGEKARVESELAEVKGSIMSQDQFFGRGQDDIINDITGVYLQDKITTFSDANGGYAKTTTVSPDRTYLEMQKMGMRVQEFNAKMDLERDKLTFDMEKEANKTTDRADALASGYSYVSPNDPEHVDLGSVYSSVQESVKKLYSQELDIFTYGTSHGNQKWSGENTGLELLINPKALDGNPYYGGSPYLRAWKVALDEQAIERPDLYEMVGNGRPKTNEEWNKLKDLNARVYSRVQQIMTNPKTREEAQYANHLQDVTANKQAVDDFLRQANESGDPEAYVRDHPMIARYGNTVYQFEVPKDTDKNTKSKLAKQMSLFQESFDRAFNQPYDVTGPSSVKTSSGTYNDTFYSPDRVKQLQPDEVSQIKVSDTGKIKVYFKENAFSEYTAKVDGEDTTDAKKSGMFYGDDRYVTVLRNGKPVKITAAEIKQKGYLEYDDPTFNRFNWSTQLGLAASAKPQRRYETSSDGQQVTFEIRKNTVTGNIDLAVNGGKFVPTNSADPDLAIKQARQIIAGRTFEELQTEQR